MKISLKAQGMTWLLRRQGRMTLQQILEYCTDGRDAVKAALQELKTLGLVNMSECRSKGRFDSYYYALTASGKTVAGKSIHGERLEDIRVLPQVEKPSLENPPTVELLQDVDSEIITSAVNGKSTCGDKKTASLSINSKRSNKSKYSNNNTTAQKLKNDEVEESEVVTVESSKKKQKPSDKVPKVLFRDTEFVLLADGRKRFRAALIARNPAYELADTDYYYERALNWSDNDNWKVNWVATVANWITDDASKNKLVKAKTNLQHDSSSKNFDTITERDLERAARIAQKYGY